MARRAGGVCVLVGRAYRRIGLLDPYVQPSWRHLPAHYGEEKNSVVRTQKFRRRSRIVILDETRISNSRPYAQNRENRRKNHGEEDECLGIDEMRENLFRSFREIPTLAVIFRPPEATCWNRRDFGEFKALNFVQIHKMFLLVVMMGRAARPDSGNRSSCRNDGIGSSSDKQDSQIQTR